MKRLKAQLGCGYKGHTCNGITLLPAPSAITCVNSNSPSSRTNDNNFYNLPRVFRGIVQQTPYIDFSSRFQSDSRSFCCDFKYDPFESDSSGFRDLYGILNKHWALGYSNSLANYGCSDSIYYSSNSTYYQGTGFLLPTPELNDFYPAKLQAIPTVALASPFRGGSTPKVKIDIQSACAGFKIYFDPDHYPTELTNKTSHLKVNGGHAIVQSSDARIQVSDASWAIALPDIGTEWNDEIYVYVWWQFTGSKRGWNGKIVHKQESEAKFKDDSNATVPINKWTKLRQIGAVKVDKDRNVEIIQQVCSPVDVRDWVSDTPLPESGEIIYVFSYQGGNAKNMKWHPVKDS